MNKDRLKEIMIDQKVVFNSRQHLIQRDIELEKHIATSQIVIISGIRRCGKSSLLFLIKEKMNLKEPEYCSFLTSILGHPKNFPRRSPQKAVR